MYKIRCKDCLEKKEHIRNVRQHSWLKHSKPSWNNDRGINFDNGQIVEMCNQEKTVLWYAGITAGSDNNSKPPTEQCRILVINTN